MIAPVGNCPTREEMIMAVIAVAVFVVFVLLGGTKVTIDKTS